MNDQLELQQYVDWLSLEYYDKRIKDYIDVRCTEDLRIGGEVSSQWLNNAPVAENQNNLYVVTEAFVTGATFFESGVSCDKGTVVYLSSTNSGLKYKLLARVVPTDSSIEEAFAELNLTVDSLTDRIVLLETQQKQQEITTKELLDQLEDHTRDSDYRFNATNAAVQAVAKDIQDVEEDITDIRKDVEHVSEDLKTVNHDIHDILHDHTTKLNAVADTFATKEALEAVEDRIDNIPQVNLDGYATEQYVQNQLANIKTPDMSGYATVEDLDRKVAALVDGAPAALNTLAELAEALEKNTEVLDTFATKSSLADVATSGSYKDLKDTPEIPSVSGLASEEFVEQAIKNIPAVDLTAYAKKEDIPDVSQFLTTEDLPEVPTKVGELENDAGYLTQHQSLEGLATEAYVQQQVASIPKPDLSGYAKKEDIPDTSKFLTSVPSDYVTEQELEDKGYLTEHQSLAGLATEEFVRKQIELIPEVDTSDLASKSDLALKADKTYVDEQLENVTIDLTGYATEDFVRTEIAKAQLGDDGETIIDLSYLATKTDLANETAKLSRRIDDLATIQYGTF